MWRLYRTTLRRSRVFWFWWNPARIGWHQSRVSSKQWSPPWSFLLCRFWLPACWSIARAPKKPMGSVSYKGGFRVCGDSLWRSHEWKTGCGVDQIISTVHRRKRYVYFAGLHRLRSYVEQRVKAFNPCTYIPEFSHLYLTLCFNSSNRIRFRQKYETKAFRNRSMFGFGPFGTGQ